MSGLNAHRTSERFCPDHEIAHESPPDDAQRGAPRLHYSKPQWDRCERNSWQPEPAPGRSRSCDPWRNSAPGYRGCSGRWTSYHHWSRILCRSPYPEPALYAMNVKNETVPLSVWVDAGPVSTTARLATGPTCSLALAHPLFGTKEFSGEDMFVSLQRLREHAEGLGVLVCVAGARLNCWPSSMQRSMARGLFVYQRALGEPPTDTDQVDLFAPVAHNDVATVKAQRDWFRAWSKSLK